MENLANILKSTRVKNKLSLQEVCEITKIRRHVIESFEKGDFTFMPSVYAKSFLATYMDLLELNMDDYKEELDQIFKISKAEKNYAPQAPKESMTTKSKNQFKSAEIYDKNLGKEKINLANIFIYISLALALAAMIYFSLFYESTPAIPTPDPTEIIQSKDAPDTAMIKSNDNDLITFFEENDSLILEARAIDTAWMKIDFDGRNPEIISLAPKQYKRWATLEFFTVTLGNAGAVEFIRNGRPIDKLGPLGKVVRNIKITPADVINPAFTPNDSTRKYYKRKRRAKKKAIPQLLEASPVEKAPIIQRTTPKPLNMRKNNDSSK